MLWSNLVISERALKSKVRQVFWFKGLSERERFLSLLKRLVDMGHRAHTCCKSCYSPSSHLK